MTVTVVSVFVLLIIVAASHLLCLVAPQRESSSQIAPEVGRVTFFLVCSVGILIYGLGIHLVGQTVPPWLLPFSAVFWTAGVSFILLSLDYHRILKATVLAVLVATPVLVFIYGGPYLLHAIDDYVDHVVFAAQATELEMPDEQPNGGPTRGSTSAARSFAETSAGMSDQSLQTSSVAKGLYFFIHAFLVSIFYGRVWETTIYARHESQERGSFHGEAIDQIVKVCAIGFSVIVACVLAGANGLNVSVVSGLFVVALSIALKDMVQNFIAGLILLWDKSIKKDDVIAVDGENIGIVQKINMRYMVLQDREDRSTLIPHSQLLESRIENWTRGSTEVRLSIDIGVAYGTDIDKVKSIMQSVFKHVPRVLADPLPLPLIVATGESSIDFQLAFKIKDPAEGIRNVRSDVFSALLRLFKEEGINIPFPQRDVNFRFSNPADLEKLSAEDLLTQEDEDDGC